MTKELSGRSNASQAVPHINARAAIVIVFEACAADPYGFVEMELEAHRRFLEQSSNREDVRSDE